MFSTGHLFFIVISFILIAAGSFICAKVRPPVRDLFKVCLCLGLLSEFTKTLDNIKILPVVEPVVENGMLIYRGTGAYMPYLEAEHLPFELCSYQIIFLILALFIRDKKILRYLYSFMYTTCIIGGLLAIILSSETAYHTTFMDYVTSVSAWRFFIYHSMIIVLGLYLGASNECGIRFKDIKVTIVLMAILDFITLYINSVMTTPYYAGDKLVGIGNGINYFSSYDNPLKIPMPDKKSWYFYLIIRFISALILILLVHIPLLIKEKKERAN